MLLDKESGLKLNVPLLVRDVFGLIRQLHDLLDLFLRHILVEHVRVQMGKRPRRMMLRPQSQDNQITNHMTIFANSTPYNQFESGCTASLLLIDTIHTLGKRGHFQKGKPKRYKTERESAMEIERDGVITPRFLLVDDLDDGLFEVDVFVVLRWFVFATTFPLLTGCVGCCAIPCG